VLVSLGLGSVIVSVLDVAPWLMEISRHKTAIFVAVGAQLALNYWLAVVRPRRMNCAPGEVCYIDGPAIRVNRVLFWISVGIYAGAVTFTSAALWWVRIQS
jgi:hypothetical protein